MTLMYDIKRNREKPNIRWRDELFKFNCN